MKTRTKKLSWQSALAAVLSALALYVTDAIRTDDAAPSEDPSPVVVQEQRAPAPEPAASKPAAAKPASVAERPSLTSFAAFRDHAWVTGTGRVVKVLPDDRNPPCHQRFLLADASGRTILIAHNIDDFARLADVKSGDYVSFRGEYIDNDQGGLVHWTHPDNSGRRAGGWLKRFPAGEGN